METTTSPPAAGPVTGSTSAPPVLGRVVVVARLQLIGQAVGAALRERGIRTHPLPWHRAARELARVLRTDDVAVLLDDLASLEDLEETCALVSATSAPCVVLTQRPPGPAWGALLAAGTCAVLTAERSLGDVSTVVDRVARGEPVMTEDRCAELVRAWEAWRREDARLRARVARLSPREQQILLLLTEGSNVVDIIGMLGIAETTVRSQIKSIRRKLGVDSQLGAVATLASVGRIA